MGQAQQGDNPAQPLMDLYNKWTGKDKKPAPAQKLDTSWHDEQVRKANESFAKPAQVKPSGASTPSGTSAPSGQSAAGGDPAKTPSYKKGGMVKKTGLAKLHAGEKVIRKKDVKRTVKAVRKYGGKR